MEAGMGRERKEEKKEPALVHYQNYTTWHRFDIIGQNKIKNKRYPESRVSGHQW